jgi:hypothetical protein
MRLAMKSASAKSLACERPKPSSSSDVSFERRRREAASKTATNRTSERASEQFLRESIECNCTESVLGQSGGAERTNERTTPSSCQVRPQARRLSSSSV